MYIKRISITIIGLAVLSSVAYTLLKGEGNIEVVPEKEIVIGTILSQTGFAASFGEMSLKGALLATEEINAKRGEQGFKIRLVSEDDQTDPKTVVGLYQKLTSFDHADVILGSNFDFMVQPLFDLAKKEGIVVVTPTASRIEGSLDTNGNSFSMLVDFSKIIETLEPYLAKTEYSKLAVVHFTSGFGNQITKTLGEISVQQGKGAVVDESYSEFGTTNWEPIILKLKKDNVDIVFADMLSDDLIRFVEKSKQLEFTAKVITHNDIRNALLKEETNTENLEGIIVLDWDALGSDAFTKKFEERFGTPPVNHASQAYVAVYILAEALSSGGRENLVSNLESKTFNTPLGTFGFDENHSITETPVRIERITDGQLVPLDF